MEQALESIIKKNLSSLVDFILHKNPNANKDHIEHKINKLNFFGSYNDNMNHKMNSVRRKEVKKSNGQLQSKNIIETITDQKDVIKVKKNHFENYVLFMESNDPKFDDIKQHTFVMDIGSKLIVGVQDSKGLIEPLNKSLIEICHKYKLRYQIPLNLNIEDDLVQDTVITNEILQLGLNYAESEDEENED